MVLCNRCAAEQDQRGAEPSHPRALTSHPLSSIQPQFSLEPSKPRELSIIEELRTESLKAESLRTGPPSPTPSQNAIAHEKQPKESKSRLPTMSIPPQLQQQLRLLIRANHILHHHGLVDAFGHISMRHPLNKEQYIIAAYDPGAPALVKNMSDFISYWVKDSTPVDADAPQGYSERYIHGEILRRFPKVNCVVHSHSEDVIPFTLGHGAREPHPVRPVFHMAGFLGQGGASVFTMDSLYGTTRASSEHDLLIKNAALGAALASRFTPDNPVVLQHKHGFTTFGASIEEAVYRSIYTQKNCVLLQRAIAIAGGDKDAVEYLSAQEIKDCATMNRKTLDKSFRLWLREVQVNPLYETEEGEPEKGKVGGMKM
jgi:ribulose-5-phosphate 4-epimerase/fuculose-1-phosphate aldolase